MSVRSQIESALDWSETPVRWENTEFTPPEDEFIRVSILPGPSWLDSISHNTTGGSGLIDVTVWAREGAGQARLLELADLASARLSRRSMASLTTLSAHIESIEADRGWAAVTVTIPYSLRGA